MSLKLKLRCQKSNHRLNLIQFICINPDCQQNRAGCFMCFPDHDGHTRQNIDIEQFFEKIQIKDKKLENDFQHVQNIQSIKKYKEQLIRSVQTQFKNLTSKIFNFLDRHCEYLVQYIQSKNLIDFPSLQKVRAYHEIFERIRQKPTQSLENKDLDFLLQFIIGNEYDQQLEHAISVKEKQMNEFNYEMNQIPVQFEFQFNELIQQLDAWITQTLVEPNYLIPQPKQENLSKSPIRTRMTKSPFRTPQRDSRSKTPDTSQKKKKQPLTNVQRLLISTPQQNSEEFIYSDKQLDIFVQYCLLNFLKEDYLNENLSFLKQNYLDIFDYNKISQKDKIQIVYEQKAHLLYVLWDNLMIEWLKPNFLLNIIVVKVHEIEDNYNSFLELFDKSLKIHDIVAWLIKQKINKPKNEYLTWLILAQKNTKSYRIYSIKSAQKKSYKDVMNEESMINEAKPSYYQNNNSFPKVLQDNLDGDLQLNRDVKILIKGMQDPNFQTYLLAERLQIMLNLVTNPQVAVNLTFQQVEKHLDSVLIDFKSFITYLNLSLRDINEY